MRTMGQCKLCKKSFKVGIKEFCSMECYKKNIQQRIEDATFIDPSHTESISKD
ncbi:hypothetical protein [Nitrosopumilus sp. S4]